MSKKMTLRLTETNTADEGKWRNRPVHAPYGLDLLKIAGFVILHIGLDPGNEQLGSDGQYHWTNKNTDQAEGKKTSDHSGEYQEQRQIRSFFNENWGQQIVNVSGDTLQ